MRVIKGSLKKHNAFTKTDMLQGIALCTKSHASFAYHHRSMQMNLKQKHKPTSSLKKVSCVVIAVFLLGAPATAHPESPPSRLYLPQHFTLIHLLDHNIPSFQDKQTTAEILHIRTVGPSFLMGAGAWNELRFPDPGTRFSAITTGRKHRPRLLCGQSTVKAGDPHGLYHLCGRTPRHPVGLSDSVPKQLHFQGSERSPPSPLYQYLLPRECQPGICQFSFLKLDATLKLSRPLV